MSRDDENATCETCKFWEEEKGPEEPDMLRCLVNPPILHPEAASELRCDALDGQWPWTQKNQWCGRHQYAKHAPKKE